MSRYLLSRRMSGTVAVLALLGILLTGGLTAHTQENKASSQKPATSQPQEGERVFMANCARCHKPPMTIPPQATGTVVMHMRVRAKLSRRDEQALLHYLAP